MQPFKKQPEKIILMFYICRAGQYSKVFNKLMIFNVAFKLQLNEISLYFYV